MKTQLAVKGEEEAQTQQKGFQREIRGVEGKIKEKEVANGNATFSGWKNKDND